MRILVLLLSIVSCAAPTTKKVGMPYAKWTANTIEYTYNVSSGENPTIKIEGNRITDNFEMPSYLLDEPVSVKQNVNSVEMHGGILNVRGTSIMERHFTAKLTVLDSESARFTITVVGDNLNPEFTRTVLMEKASL